MRVKLKPKEELLKININEFVYSDAKITDLGIMVELKGQSLYFNKFYKVRDVYNDKNYPGYKIKKLYWPLVLFNTEKELHAEKFNEELENKLK